jgi:hypothetical protein
MNAITKYIFSVGNPPGKWSLENQERDGRKIFKLCGREMICEATKWIMIMPSGRLSITNISVSVLTHTWSVQKVSDLWLGKIHLQAWRSATLTPFEVVPL